MDYAKYIMVGRFPVIFHPGIQHSDVSVKLLVGKNEIKSAGFIKQTDDGHFVCYGESTSLGLQSNPEIDSKLVDRLLKG